MLNPSRMPTGMKSLIKVTLNQISTLFRMFLLENHEVTYEDAKKAIRIVTLHRSESCLNLGFSIRGGIEHGLGHFVSNVEPGSEADRQGK
jgi:hypothetical protein